jgi:Ca-activated chloride channel family protein
MGGEMGAPIPLMQNGQKVGTKKDKEGNTVLTKLNEKMLIDVANAGGGSYSRANGMSVGLEGLVEQINTTEKSALGKEKYTAYDDHFQPFLWLGILLLLIDILILENKTTIREHFKISKL